jgi:hypothetical protein
LYVTIPQKSVGVTAYHHVDVWNFCSNFHIFQITCVTDCNQNIDSALLEAFRFIPNALYFVKDFDVTRGGDILHNLTVNKPKETNF